MRLQTEIDKLAVLLDDVKKQSDRIQAMADSIGDRLLHGISLPAETRGSMLEQKREGITRSAKVVQISAPF